MRKGFKPCPNFLWDIEGLNSKDRDVILFLFSHNENFIPTLTYIANKCSFGISNTKQVKEVLSRIKIILENQPANFQVVEDFKTIKNKVINTIITIRKSLEIRGEKKKKSINSNIILSKNNSLSTLKIIKTNIKNKGQEYKEEINKEKEIEYQDILLSKKQNIKVTKNNIDDFKSQISHQLEFILSMEEINGQYELFKKYYNFFIDYLENKKDRYKNYLAAFRNCIRSDWGNIKTRFEKEKNSEKSKKTFQQMESDRIRTNLEKIRLKKENNNGFDTGKYDILIP